MQVWTIANARAVNGGANPVVRTACRRAVFHRSTTLPSFVASEDCARTGDAAVRTMPAVTMEQRRWTLADERRSRRADERGITPSPFGA